MIIRKAMVPLSDRGEIRWADVIAYAGEMWIAPEWHDLPSEGRTSPAWLIPLARLEHQPPTTPDGVYIVNQPIPVALLDGPISPDLAANYGVVERPPVSFARPTE